MTIKPNLVIQIMQIELSIVLCVVSTGLSVLLHSMNRSNVWNINFDFIVIDVNIFMFGISCHFRQSNSFGCQATL